MALYGQATLRTLQQGIDQREDFRAGNVRGSRTERIAGRLTGEAYAKWTRDYNWGQMDFVVYSYETPIAWHTEDGWVQPTVKYSATTTNHQNRVAVAIANPGFYDRGHRNG